MVDNALIHISQRSQDIISLVVTAIVVLNFYRLLWIYGVRLGKWARVRYLGG